jgi:hypothetical protein
MCGDGVKLAPRQAQPDLTTCSRDHLHDFCKNLGSLLKGIGVGVIPQQHLTEYEKLKDEQIARITSRDNLLNFNIVSLATLTTIAVSLSQANAALLVAPWISVIFGWAYIQHEQKITSIGRYLRQIDPGSFIWEASAKQVVLPKLFHATITTTTLLIAFAAPCIACPIIWYLRVPQHEVLLVIVGIAEVLAGICMAVVILATLAYNRP